MPRLALTFALLISAAALAAPAPKKVSTPAMSGTALIHGKQFQLRWSSWFDQPVDDVTARLVSWSSAYKVLKEAVSFEMHHEASDATPARFAIKRKSPVFFMPDPTIVFDASHRRTADGATVISWKLVEGPPKRAERTWTLIAEAGGTRVSHFSDVELPFDPPDFMLDSPEEELVADVERFRKVVGAERAHRAPPKPATTP